MKFYGYQTRMSNERKTNPSHAKGWANKFFYEFRIESPIILKLMVLVNYIYKPKSMATMRSRDNEVQRSIFDVLGRFWGSIIFLVFYVVTYFFLILILKIANFKKKNSLESSDQFWSQNFLLKIAICMILKKLKTSVFIGFWTQIEIFLHWNNL